MDIVKSIKKFIDDSRHVLSISYKPTEQEFNKSIKVILLGIALIGAIGFILAIVISLVITGSLILI